MLWSAVWKKPQAVMWERLGLHFQVAAYVRAFLESTAGDASAGLKTAVLRMEGELGLSVPGMNSLRWKIARDEVAEQRDAAESAPATPMALERPRSARDRMRLLEADAG